MMTKGHLFPLCFREKIEALTSKCQELEEAKRQERDLTVAVTQEVPCDCSVPSILGMGGTCHLCLQVQLLHYLPSVTCPNDLCNPDDDVYRCLRLALGLRQLDRIGAALQRQEDQKGREEE